MKRIVKGRKRMPIMTVEKKKMEVLGGEDDDFSSQAEEKHSQQPTCRRALIPVIGSNRLS